MGPRTHRSKRMACGLEVPGHTENASSPSGKLRSRGNLKIFQFTSALLRAMFDCLGPLWESVLALVNMSTTGKPCSDSCSFHHLPLGLRAAPLQPVNLRKAGGNCYAEWPLAVLWGSSMSHHSLRAMQQVQELVLTSAKKTGPFQGPLLICFLWVPFSQPL